MTMSPKLLRLHASVALCVFLLLFPQAMRAAEQRILVLGDSISAAYGMSLQQGWVSLLETRLRGDGLSVAVINASISGETTAGGLKRLPALLAEHTPHYVLVELGGNDGLRGYPIQLFRDALTDIVISAQNSGAKVLLLPMEIPPNYGARYTQAFRQTFIDVASATGCTLGPFILGDVATNPTLMQQDGIHPTSAAQPAIVDTVYDSIVAMLEAA